MEFIGCRRPDVPISEACGSFWPEKSDVQNIEEKLQQLREKAGKGFVVSGNKSGPVQHFIEVLEAVALAFVPVEFQFHSQQGAQFMKDENPSRAGSGQQQLSVCFEDAMEFFQTFCIIVQVLEIVEANYLVECFVFEWKAFRSDLQYFAAEKVESGFAVEKVQVSAHPETALFPQEIAENPLCTSQIEDRVGGSDIEIFLEQLEFFPLFEGSFHQLQLPRFSAHEGGLYHK